MLYFEYCICAQNYTYCLMKRIFNTEMVCAWLIISTTQYSSQACNAYENNGSVVLTVLKVNWGFQIVHQFPEITSCGWDCCTQWFIGVRLCLLKKIIRERITSLQWTATYRYSSETKLDIEYGRLPEKLFFARFLCSLWIKFQESNGMNKHVQVGRHYR